MSRQNIDGSNLLINENDKKTLFTVKIDKKHLPEQLNMLILQVNSILNIHHGLDF